MRRYLPVVVVSVLSTLTTHALMSSVAVAAPPKTPKVAEVVQARSFELLDSKGRTRARLVVRAEHKRPTGEELVKYMKARLDLSEWPSEERAILEFMPVDGWAPTLSLGAGETDHAEIKITEGDVSLESWKSKQANLRVGGIGTTSATLRVAGSGAGTLISSDSNNASFRVSTRGEASAVEVLVPSDGAPTIGVTGDGRLRTAIGSTALEVT